MKLLNYTHPATIMSVTPKIGTEDDFTVKIAVQVGLNVSNAVATLIPEAGKQLFNKDGDIEMPVLKQLHFTKKFENISITVMDSPEVPAIEVDGCLLTKFMLKEENDQPILKFNIHMQVPSDIVKRFLDYGGITADINFLERQADIEHDPEETPI